MTLRLGIRSTTHQQIPASAAAGLALSSPVRRLAFLVLVVMSLVAPSLQGQLTTGSLSGTVRDSSGALVPGAKINLLNEATSDGRATVSNSAGYFTFAAVQPGTYTVRVEASGFQLWRQTGISMNSGDTDLFALTVNAFGLLATVPVLALTRPFGLIASEVPNRRSV